LQGTNSLQLRVLGPDVLPPLPAAVEVAAYRITLESLTNIIRHAQASECCVHLSLSDALYLEVEDNGVGIPPANRAGVGLRSMRERAAELGGTLVVESAPAGGTRILAQLPLSF
jgi:two-component system NarL family sensor kinase